MTTNAPSTSSPPKTTSPRFTLELEFVLSLANPYYLSHLAVTYPHLLNPPESASATSKSKQTTGETDSDAAAFAAYLAYLYSYWQTPEYSQYLTHPGATLRALRLLQEESFRADVIKLGVIDALMGFGEVPEVEVTKEEDVAEGNKGEQTQDGDVVMGT